MQTRVYQGTKAGVAQALVALACPHWNAIGGPVGLPRHGPSTVDIVGETNSRWEIRRLFVYLEQTQKLVDDVENCS
jgi:hypothetical protein